MREAPAASMTKFETVIGPTRSTLTYWRDCWHFRELLLILVWRDLLVRYKQTVFGIAWAVIRPVVTMVVFTVIFGRIANLPSNDVPYPLMVFAALLPWLFFAATFADSGNSIVGNAQMVSKVYFPRLILPLSSIFVGLVDFGFAFLVLIGLALWYQYLPGWQIVFLPLLIVLMCLLTFAAGIWVAALNVKYRDFRYLVPFAIQLGTYVSPVGFSSSVVPERWQWLYALNPMVGIIDGFRWCLLGGSTPLNLQALTMSVVGTLLLLVPGIWFFRRSENRFADVI
jgi:lipopolysaccharide transport system permease protein